MRRTTLLGLFFVLFLGTGLAVGADAEMAAAEKLIRAKSYKERLDGIAKLEAIGGERAERLTIKLLKDADWDVQVRAIRSLAKIGKDAARKALIRAAVKGDVLMVRQAAAESLKSLEPERSATRLLELAKKEKESERKARAIDAAAVLLSAEHLKKLRPLTRMKDLYGQAAAVRALGDIAKHEELREEVLKSLDKTLRLRDDLKYFHSYVAAIEALGQIDQDEVRTRLVSELVNQIDDDPYVPERIARVLARWDQEAVGRAINEGFAKAKKPPAIQRLLQLCSRIQAKGVRVTVEAQLGHKEARVRSEAVRALGVIGDKTIGPKVAPKLKDKDPFVAVEAVTALWRTLPGEEFRAHGEAIAELDVMEARLQYVVELAKIHGSTDTAEIEATIDSLLPFAHDKAWRVSTAAIVTIGTLGLAKDLPKIQEFAKSKKWRLRAAAFEAFGRLRAIQSVPLLCEGLDDKDPVVRGVCHANLQILLRKKFEPDRELWEDHWENSKQGFELIKLSRRTKEEIAKDQATAERNRIYGDSIKKDKGIEILQKARILVIAGAWDKVEVVLDHLNIDHTLLRAQQLKKAGLNPNQIVLINCEGNIDKDTRARLRWFTNVGGYVMTTDWALTKAVRVSFPGYIEQASRSSTGNDVVVVEEALPRHKLTRGVFEDVAALKWWLEIQAFPVENKYPERCQVIVDSAEMRQRYGTSPMAAVFDWGLGKVQHSVSHFYLQEEGMAHVTDTKDRMIFARDNLGLSTAQIRSLRKKGAFSGSLTEGVMREIAPDYSMFRLIVNMVAEKSQWVENL